MGCFHSYCTQTMERGWRLLPPPPPPLFCVFTWPSLSEVRGGPKRLEPVAVATTARFGLGVKGAGCCALRETVINKEITDRQAIRTLFMVLIVFQGTKA